MARPRPLHGRWTWVARIEHTYGGIVMSVRTWVGTLTAAILAATGQAAVGPPVQASSGAGGAWGPVTRLAGYTHFGSVTMDRAGNATAVWGASTGGIVAERRSVGGTWGSPEVIGQGNAPQVATDADGDVIVVWHTQRTGFTDGVAAAERTVDGHWSDPVQLSHDRSVPTYPGDHLGPWGAAHARLAVAPSGAAVVTWAWGSEDRGKPWRIQAAYRPAGGPWQPTERVTRPRGARDPQVGIANDGTATLLYVRQASGDPHRLIARRRLVGRGWTAPTRVVRDGYDEQLAVDRYGDAMVAYTSVLRALKATYRPVDHPWLPPRRLSAKAGEAFSLAMNRPGRAVVAIARSDGSVVVVRRPRQGPWGPPGVVQPSGTEAVFVSVALNGSGDTLLVWGYHALYSRYRTHHRAWGRRFTVSPDAGVNVLEGLQSVISAHGDAAVMWTQEELPLKVRVRSAS